MQYLPASRRGMTLIDILVGSAVTLMIFLAVYGLLRASAQVSTLASETAAATAIANSQMEYIRSLSYDSIGTVGGIPAGLIAQNATTTEDNIDYAVRTFIDYYDDPADGTGSSDTNGITTDYKRAKVTVSFTTTTGSRQISIVSNFTPNGIETTTGGGTLKVNVVNSTGSPLAGASVRITNASVSPSVDVTTFSDSTGIVYLPGAATSTDYHVTVSKTGYSTAQTYDRDATNQNPNPGHLTVVNNVITSSTFAIDALASLILRSFSPIAAGSFSDTFNDASKLAVITNGVVSGGAFTNAPNSGGGYLSPAIARSTAVAPPYLAAWTSATASFSLPGGTSEVVHITDGSGTILPDSALPGNSVGFSAFPIDLSGISTSTYPSLSLNGDLIAGASAPSLLDWGISYTSGPTPLPNVSFSLTGAKTIGSTGAGAPIYKTTVSSTTGSTASTSLSLEWDSYQLAVPSYDIVDACPAPPYNILAGSSNDSRLILGPSTSNALLVSVKDASGAVLPGASVTLSRVGYSQTVTASACGTAYFGGISAQNDYSLSATSGSLTASYSNVTVSGSTIYAAVLN